MSPDTIQKTLEAGIIKEIEDEHNLPHDKETANNVKDKVLSQPFEPMGKSPEQWHELEVAEEEKKASEMEIRTMDKINQLTLKSHVSTDKKVTRKKILVLEKSIFPTDEQISKLNLEFGSNEITYTVHSRL
jgi:hypothetical protein